MTESERKSPKKLSNLRIAQRGQSINKSMRELSNSTNIKDGSDEKTKGGQSMRKLNLINGQTSPKNAQ